MSVRNISFYLVATCCAALFASGCKKSSSEATTESQKTQTAPQAPPKLETVARIHWLGKKRIAADTNAAALMGIWNMPETQKLEAQTLDKLALAPWGLPREGTNTAAIVATNPPSLLFRPLLEDLLQEEFYLEVRGATNLPTELAVAVRVDENRSQLWKTNLSAVLNSLTNRPTPITSHQAPAFLRAGDWMVVAFSPSTPDTQHSTPWIQELSDRLGKNAEVFPSETTNSCLQLELDLQGFSTALGLEWHLPDNSPKVSLAAGLNDGNIRSTGHLDFSKPLQLDLEPWNIPTNLVHSRLDSFTAIRGFKPWFAASKLPALLRMDSAPNQLFLWSQIGFPFQTYVALPLANASNYVSSLTGYLEQNSNDWLAKYGLGEIKRTTNAAKMKWTKIPYIEPFLEAVTTDANEFVLGGFGPFTTTNHPIPAELLAQVLGPTNLLVYDWELSGPRMDDLPYITQITRAAVHKAQLPTKGYFFPWFEAIAPKLGNAGMTVNLTAPNQLSFVRKSTIGFSALELHFLADWLESPNFPSGLHTFVAPPDLPQHLPANKPTNIK